MYSTWLSVRPSVRPSVCYQLVNTVFCKRLNQCCCKSPQVVHWARGEISFGVMRSKVILRGQGPGTPNLDLET